MAGSHLFYCLRLAREPDPRKTDDFIRFLSLMINNSYDFTLDIVFDHDDENTHLFIRLLRVLLLDRRTNEKAPYIFL